MSIVCKWGLPDTATLLKTLPMQLSLLQVWFFPSSYSIMFNDNFWYVSALFTLYLLFPLLNVVTDMLSLRTKKILCVALPIVSFYCYYISIMLGQAFQSYYMSALFRIFEFWLGILLVDITQASHIKVRWYAFIGVSLLCAVAMYIAFPYFQNHYNLYNIILLPYYSFLIFTVVKMEGLPKKLAGSRVVRYMADCGLACYLCQSITCMWKGRFIIRPDLAYIVVTLVLAVLVHEIIEKPCKKVLKKLASGKFAMSKI